jgi:hypothetical protein
MHHGDHIVERLLERTIVVFVRKVEKWSIVGEVVCGLLSYELS